MRLTFTHRQANPSSDVAIKQVFTFCQTFCSENKMFEIGKSNIYGVIPCDGFSFLWTENYVWKSIAGVERKIYSRPHHDNRGKVFCLFEVGFTNHRNFKDLVKYLILRKLNEITFLLLLPPLTLLDILTSTAAQFEPWFLFYLNNSNCQTSSSEMLTTTE